MFLETGYALAEAKADLAEFFMNSSGIVLYGNRIQHCTRGKPITKNAKQFEIF